MSATVETTVRLPEDGSVSVTIEVPGLDPSEAARIASRALWTILESIPVPAPDVAGPEPEGSASPEPTPAVDDTDATPLSSHPVTLRDLEGRKWKRVTRSTGDVVYEHGSLTPLTIHDLVYIDGSVTDVSSGRTITANDLGDLT